MKQRYDKNIEENLEIRFKLYCQFLDGHFKLDTVEKKANDSNYIIITPDRANKGNYVVLIC